MNNLKSKIANQILVLLAIAVLISCNDDFLERGPLSSINDALFWKSANDLELYCNNFYNQNGLLPRYDGYSTVGPYSEDATQGADTYIHHDYNKRMNGEGTIPQSGGGWDVSDWTILRNINYFVDRYSVVPEKFDIVKKYVGEALFFRSVFYFVKLRRFGDLPWVSTELFPGETLSDGQPNPLYSRRLSRHQVVDSIMRDLDSAVLYLPARGTGSWTGRINKETALALQARIALYEGTWERYHALKNTNFKVTGSDGTRFLQKAADVSDTLMAMAVRTGYPALDNVGVKDGYWMLFNQYGDAGYSASKEVLFWRKYSNSADIYNYWIRYTVGGAGRGLTKTMIDSYLCMDGRPIFIDEDVPNPLYMGDDSLHLVVANRDPRLNQTIYVNDGEHYRWKPDEFFETPVFGTQVDTRCVTGYQLYKGHTADRAEYNLGSGTNSCIYFRYAETLLINAEAKAELKIITQDDIDKTINALRERVGMPGLRMNAITTDPNWEFGDYLSPLLQEIRRERKVELACEGFRVDDIFRWAAADELIVGKRPKGAILKQWATLEPSPPPSQFYQADEKGYIDPYGIGAVLEEMKNGYKFNVRRDYLYPIPYSELTLNPLLRPQNPGW